MGILSWFFRTGKKSEPIVKINGPGTFSIDVVGESNYQYNLESICGGKTEDSQNIVVTAILIHEDNNRYDNKAILVSIYGKPVGYLSRDNARQFRQRLAEEGFAGLGAICQAKIVGGWRRDKNNEGHFGVKLDLPTQK